MSTQIDRVVAQLRDMILSGELLPGERIVELQFTERLGASRTPLRLALVELEREGILERLPSRGFKVRSFSITDIVDALEVRGALEALATRLLLQKGVTCSFIDQLGKTIDAGRRLIEPTVLDSSAEIDAMAWAEVNGRFHATLLEGAANRALSDAIERNNRAPFVGPNSVILPAVPTTIQTSRLVRAQHDHEDIFAAILRKEHSRAEALILEHAYRSKENKIRLIEEIQKDKAPTTQYGPLLTQEQATT
ncbi:GntR family transcriptional regulator [Paraburkholderia fungorum]|uniref:GntR family transcriptional regulator n=1 Tax=Paraburkholderia fungorum TaxID=134537 RepID=A0AAP5QJ91_9BURK|nr:GntR family transcriptional regulator [Paraburkholderia fungorum]MDT8843620.1 GntR family transcriptional regulator [Paraburkholderia fungorum]